VNNEVKAEREEDEAGVLLDDTEERDSEETAVPSPTVISEPSNP